MNLFIVIFRVLFIVFFFGFCIFIHEFGHLIVALWQGLYVERFSIGFGKKIFGFTYKGVEFIVGCLPFGGYVMLPQLDPTENPKTADGRELKPSSPKARALTAFAGPFFNILFGFFLAAVMCLVGLWEAPVSSSVMVGEVPMLLPVASGELKETDKIVEIDGAPVEQLTWADLCYMWAAAGVPPLEEGMAPGEHQLTVLRGRERVEVAFAPEINPEWAGGLRKGDRIVKVNGKAISKGVTEFRNEYLFAKNAQVILEVRRGDETLELSFVPAPNPAMENLGYPFFDVGNPITVGSVREGSPADKAGVSAGDQLLSLNGESILSVGWLEGKLAEEGLENLDFLVLHDSRENRLSFAMQDLHTGNGSVLNALGIHFNVLVESVVEGLPADKAGLLPEDRIAKADGVELNEAAQLTAAIRSGEGKTIVLSVERMGKMMEVPVTPAVQDVNGEKVYQIGVLLSDMPSRIIGHPSPWSQFHSVFSMTTRTLGLLFSPITRKVESVVSGKSIEAPRAGVKLHHLSGPLGIVSMLWIRLQTEGLRGGMSFIILITFSLAFMNLLPLPVLDGGHIVFAGIEAVLHRRLPVKLVSIINNVFGALLIALMLYVTVFDGKRIYNWSSHGDGDEGVEAPQEEVPLQDESGASQSSDKEDRP